MTGVIGKFFKQKLDIPFTFFSLSNFASDFIKLEGYISYTQ